VRFRTKHQWHNVHWFQFSRKSAQSFSMSANGQKWWRRHKENQGMTKHNNDNNIIQGHYDNNLIQGHFGNNVKTSPNICRGSSHYVRTDGHHRRWLSSRQMTSSHMCRGSRIMASSSSNLTNILSYQLQEICGLGSNGTVFIGLPDTLRIRSSVPELLRGRNYSS
jgi:hypothetical protein